MERERERNEEKERKREGDNIFSKNKGKAIDNHYFKVKYLVNEYFGFAFMTDIRVYCLHGLLSLVNRFS